MDFNVSQIISEASIIVQFQIVLSHHKEFPRSMEAFIKGVDPLSGDLIHPLELFGKAEEEGLLEALNYMMVEVVLDRFQRLYGLDPEILLFVNVHESLVVKGHETIDVLRTMIEEKGIRANNIAFDLADYPDIDVSVVKTFILSAREAGFYISLDDIGKGYFNLDRMMVFNPDIIKINQQYMDKLSYKSYRERLKKQTSYLAHEMGIIVVMTGIETEEELSEAFKLGCQYFQGYHLGKPMVVEDDMVADYLDMSQLYEHFQSYTNDIKVDETRKMMNQMVLVLNELRERSKKWSEATMNEGFATLFYRYPYIQKAWVVDMAGVQVTTGRINNEGFSKKNAHIFKIYDVGHDFSSEEFYRIIKMGALDVWITKLYVSLLNNRLSFGTSSIIEPQGGQQYILCLEVNYAAFRKSQVIN